MTCDDAFDALTDPLRSEDADLKQHLTGCPRCRQMQDVLQPALALFGSPTEELPFDTGPAGSFVNSESVADAESASRELRRRASQSARRRRRFEGSPWLGTVVAAVLFVSLTGLGLATIALNAARATRNEASVVCLWQKRGTTPTVTGGRAVTSRQVVQSCVACHTVTSID